MSDNPWIAEHVETETDFQDGDRALAERLVAIEYADAPPPIVCPHGCGATSYFKSTIGAYKCPSCGGLADYHGDRIGTEWSIQSTHEPTECRLCQQAVANAVALAKSTGSTEATHADGQHAARVKRVTP